MRNVFQLAIQITREMLNEAAALQLQAAQQSDRNVAKSLSDQANRLSKHAFLSQSKSRLDAMIKIGETKLAISREDLDPDNLLLGIRNGVIDLRTGNFRSGKREELITLQSKADWIGNELAGCPTWEKFLSKVQPDPDMRRWLQKFAGYCLTGRTDEQIVTIFHGDGANGKSVFAEVLKAVMGTYAKTVQFETFSAANKSPTRNDLAGLDKTRLVVAQEGAAGTRLDEGLIKQLSGGDQVSARYLYREYFSYEPQFKIILVTNHRPIVTSMDHGIWRRLVMVPWKIVIAAEERDTNLKEKLLQELPGILEWAVQGTQLWLKEGLKDRPKAIDVASRDYQKEQDIVSQWIDECCNIENQGCSTSRSLFESYKSWSDRNGYPTISQRTLGDRFRLLGLVAGKSGGDRVWRGITLK